MPSFSSSSMQRSTISLPRRTSESAEIIGNITAILPFALARKTARICSRNIAGRASETRMPRQPRKGFGSGSVSGSTGNLSPPASSVRTITVCGDISMATRE